MRFIPRVILVPLLAFLFVAACGSDDADGGSGATPTPRDATAIRSLDLAGVAAVDRALDQYSGAIDETAVMYVDLTEDGREDAVVPISSEGTLGNLAYVVLTLRDGAPEAILTRTAEGSPGSGVQMALEAGQLTATVADYGPEDPLCCPTFLRKTYYRWDGTQLQVEKEDRFANPDAQTKD